MMGDEKPFADAPRRMRQVGSSAPRSRWASLRVSRPLMLPHQLLRAASDTLQAFGGEVEHGVGATRACAFA